MSDITAPRFFLGANSPQGFYSLFDELEQAEQPWHSFLIKGGPGCGKSSFLKKVAALYAASCPKLELFPCSSDPGSLDAVLLPEQQLSLMDATAPHTKEASIPAVRHTLFSFGEYLDGTPLQKHRQEIEALFAATPKYYQLACAYLNAAQTFLRNSYEIADRAVDREKLDGYARRFAAKYFPPMHCAGSEKRRFLSTICADGVITLEDTPQLLCRRIYLIDDDCGAVAHRLLTQLRHYALTAGHEVITCRCPMAPEQKIEHLLIPTTGIAFLTSNHFHAFSSCGSVRKIHARRFQNQEPMKLRKERFLSNRKAAQTLLAQAIVILHESRQLHDKLESLYQNSMDFDALNSHIPHYLQLLQKYSHHK